MDFVITDILEIAPPFYFIGALINTDVDVSDDYELTSPSARLTGTIITSDAELVNYLRELVRAGTRKVSSNEYINQDTFLTFYQRVTLTFTSIYPLKNYPRYTTNSKTFVGEPAFDYQNDKAEIRYTLNGKVPKISSKLYKREIIFKQNHSGTENMYMRYRVIYKGKKSGASTLRFKIQKEKKQFYQL
jgi:hypothetical protein